MFRFGIALIVVFMLFAATVLAPTGDVQAASQPMPSITQQADERPLDCQIPLNNFVRMVYAGYDFGSVLTLSSDGRIWWIQFSGGPLCPNWAQLVPGVYAPPGPLS